MAGTTMVTVKEEVFTQLSTLITGAKVFYGDPGDKAPRECVIIDNIEEGEVEPVALRSGRRKRDEEYILTIRVEVASKHTPLDSEKRAVAIGTTIEEYLADNTDLGGKVAWAIVSGSTMRTNQTDQVRTVLDYEVTVRARLL